MSLIVRLRGLYLCEDQITRDAKQEAVGRYPVIGRLGMIATAKCPDCGRRIELGTRSRMGRILACPRCDAALEVVSLDLPLLDLVYPELRTRKDN